MLDLKTERQHLVLLMDEDCLKCALLRVFLADRWSDNFWYRESEQNDLASDWLKVRRTLCSYDLEYVPGILATGRSDHCCHRNESEVDGESDAVLPSSNARQVEEENFPCHPPIAIRSGPSHKIYRIERRNFPTTRVRRRSAVR